ncbi:AraC family transcriptional regulator [Paenibacillus sp. GP183]|uniref:helix-turn-helix transcriptional regulator n=1 Tax=Paenibacillus sp. GP183 TaxID=1882751 RepID=UPI00089D8880|nr:AraC family transcriptional regulator [Paenibacillus sp. GP183]SEC67436.1 AraC-type DNA-binding protein [Paenibacillus sp. GP183]
MQMEKERVREANSLTFGDEEGEFYFQHVHRTKAFERMNHYHSTYEIYYLLSGQRTYFIKDKTYRIYGGDLIFINKHDLHQSTDLGKLGHERIVINFSDFFLGSDHPLYDPVLFRIFEQNCHLLRLNPPEQAFVESILNKLSKELVKQDVGYERYIRLLLIELLLFAARHMDRSVTEDTVPANPLHTKITDIVKYINEQYHSHLSLTGLSDTFFISPYYLSRTFKAVTGFTLIEYVNLTRIKEAQRLLKETDHKIIDIAEAVGFDSIGHFDRTFKNIAAITPMTYRKLRALS